MAQRLLADIGNGYADAIPFQAGIAPDTRVSALKAPERENLAANLARV
jgi:formamidopyrimidine-DNA glycosylase